MAFHRVFVWAMGCRFKAEHELTEKHVGDESGDDEGYNPVKEVKILEHYEVAQGPLPYRIPAPLGQKPDKKAYEKRESNRCCHGTRGLPWKKMADVPSGPKA